MKRLYSAALFCVLAFAAANAQSRLTVEVAAGVPFYGLPGLTGAPAQTGLSAGFEARHSLASVPALSFGAQASFSPAWCSHSDFETSVRTKYHKYYITPELIIDYNILPGRKISPFASIGAGVQGNIKVHDGEPARRDFGGIVNPRLGIEFFHRIRVSGELKKRFDKSTEDDYFAVNVSWIFVSKKIYCHVGRKQMD